MGVRNITLLCIAGLASSAAAQSGSLSIVPSIDFDGPSPTTSFTLSVYADADFGTHVTGAAFTLNAGDRGSLVDSVEVLDTNPWGALGFDDFGYGGDGDHNGLIMGQITFLPFIQPDAASVLGNGPVFIASFQVTLVPFATGTFDWTVAGGIGTFALEVIDVNANPDGNPPGQITQVSNPNFGSASVVIFPAPSTAALFGMSALVAGRRRR